MWSCRPSPRRSARATPRRPLGEFYLTELLAPTNTGYGPLRVRNLGLLRGPERVRRRPRTDRLARHRRRRQHRPVSQPRLHPPAATRTSRPSRACCRSARRSRSSKPERQPCPPSRSRRKLSPRSIASFAAASARVFSSRGTHWNATSRPAISVCARAREHLHVGMLDLPAPRHLLDHELRVQPDEDGCRRHPARRRPRVLRSCPLYSATLLVATPT